MRPTNLNEALLNATLGMPLSLIPILHGSYHSAPSFTRDEGLMFISETRLRKAFYDSLNSQMTQVQAWLSGYLNMATKKAFEETAFSLEYPYNGRSGNPLKVFHCKGDLYKITLDSNSLQSDLRKVTYLISLAKSLGWNGKC